VIPHGVEIFVGLEPIDLRWSFDRRLQFGLCIGILTHFTLAAQDRFECLGEQRVAIVDQVRRIREIVRKFLRCISGHHGIALFDTRGSS
jgi:hypothetical protein